MTNESKLKWLMFIVDSIYLRTRFRCPCSFLFFFIDDARKKKRVASCTRIRRYKGGVEEGTMNDTTKFGVYKNLSIQSGDFRLCEMFLLYTLYTYTDEYLYTHNLEKHERQQEYLQRKGGRNQITNFIYLCKYLCWKTTRFCFYSFTTRRR